MTDQHPIITEEMKAKVGRYLEPVVFEVEKGAIRRFAEAVDDPNPLYTDEEYARNTPYGGIVSPPGFFGWPVRHKVGMETLLGTEAVLNIAGTPKSNVFNAGNECELFLPVRPGDVLVASPKLAELYEKSGKSGRMLFIVFEVTYNTRQGGGVRSFSSSATTPLIRGCTSRGVQR